MTPSDAERATPIVGMEATVEERVTEEMTAPAVGSGDVSVLATPIVLALVERASVAAVQEHLPQGVTTVGASAELTHHAPSPVGATVHAHSVLDQVEGRSIKFRFTVSDDAGEIATGTHVRVLVDRDRFEASAARRGREDPPP